MMRATDRSIPALVSLPLSLGAVLLISACAGSRAYPSLAVRDIERVEGSASAASGSIEAPPALPAPTADLTTRLAGLVDIASEAHEKFKSRQPVAERAISGVGGAISDSWTNAQVALSSLQAARSGVLTSLGELDQLYADARIANPEQVSPTAAAIEAARSQVESWVSSENAVIERLSARLR
ncbi:hypothetical protein ABVV53_07810 [Novosphingobium sp. RD2P27]|uniref:Lipoprotein n=1 Tax=Novosphingobium kalidii TaxID=3230299 RepID=A0ABV2D0G3_9SPHN